MLGMHCQCENAAHFDKSPKYLNEPTHHYQRPFSPDELEIVNTTYGKFLVCQACKSTCLKDCLR